MKKRIAACLLLITLNACSNLFQPTPAVIPTLTAVPTRTVTIAPTLTPLPPSETPETGSEWNGVPIMPGEIAGEGDEDGYVFTIKATPQRVQEYYQRELGNLGWQLLSQEADDSSMILMFVNGASETLTIHVIAKDEEALVLFVK